MSTQREYEYDESSQAMVDECSEPDTLHYMKFVGHKNGREVEAFRYVYRDVEGKRHFGIAGTLEGMKARVSERGFTETVQ